jgi:thiol-disulfide isomerase/thioredoxin
MTGKRGPADSVGFAVIAACVAVGTCSTDAAADARDGAAAELREDAAAVLARYALRDRHGETSRLEGLRGRVVVVNFWAAWCKPCRTELPLLDAWHRDLAGRGGAVVAVSIDIDSLRALDVIDAERLTLPVFYDGPDGLARDLAIPHVPFTLVLDRGGSVVCVAREASGKSLASLRRAVDALLAAPAPGPADAAAPARAHAAASRAEAAQAAQAAALEADSPAPAVEIGGGSR